MPQYKTSLATESVKRYLLQIIAKSGTEPVRLLPERELAEKLRVSRVTVRRAIEELEGSNHIIRLPGRNGAFTNPSVSAAVGYTVGIVIYHCYVGQIFSQFLNGLSTELYALGYNCSFTLLARSESNPEKEAFELENCGCDCIVWHTQTSGDLSVIDRMLRDGFPVLTICNPNFPEWGHPARGWYAFDMDAGEEIAAYFLDRGCVHTVFCSEESIRYRSFETRMQIEKKGAVNALLANPEEVRKQLPVLLKKKMIDGIYCSYGCSGRCWVPCLRDALFQS